MKRLVIRPGAIGDFILSLPAIESLREGYLEVWARRPNVPLARLADRARAIEATGLDLLEVTEPDPGLAGELRAFDSIVSWYGSNRAAFRERVAELGLPFTFLPALPPEGCGMHAVDYYLASAREAGARRRHDGVPRIACPPGPREGAVIHPFASSARKRWPMERFRELANALEKRMKVEWCAGPEDPLEGALRIADLYELALRLARARIFIGNDSGISHLAAAVGTTVVVLFGPTDPAVWAPRGPDVRVCARRSLEEITVEEVLSRTL